MSNTQTIAKNTGWLGVETAIDNILTLFTSIAIARYLGPKTAGSILFVQWVAQVAGNIGAVGIPATLRKYMGEFLGKGDKGTARFIFLRTLWLQTLMASLATPGIVLWVSHEPSAELRIACILIGLSIWPQMVNSIPAQANVAAEDLFRNMPASAISMATFFCSIAATVYFHWGVIGVGASVLLCRSVDFLVRFIPTYRWITSWEITHAHPDGLWERAFGFAMQSLLTMALGMVVWDRSEYFLLKYRCSDISQIAFYSVAFSMANRLLLSSAIFGSATGATIFAQFGRDESKLPRLVSSTFRYLAMSSIPIHTLFTALAIPVLLVLYGDSYAGAEAVVVIAPLLCMSKAFYTPVQNLLQSFEKQRAIIAVTIFAGVIDMGLAWVLIPTRGAVGACIANGVAQFVAVAMLWGIAIATFKIKLPWLLTAKVTLVSVVAALAGYFCAERLLPTSAARAHVTHSMHYWVINASAVLVCGSVSLAVLLVLFYAFRILQEEDGYRLHQVASMLPGPLPSAAKSLVSVLSRSKSLPEEANAALL